MQLEITPATLPDEYETITAIHNEAMPGNELAPDAMTRHFENPPEKYLRQIFVGYVQGKAVATGSYWQEIWAYDPQRFRVHVNVRPGFQTKGLGQALYEQVLTALVPHRPQQLLCRARESDHPSVRFVEKQGFVEIDREWESAVDPLAAELGRLDVLEAKLAHQGVVITTLAELQRQDPAHQRKIYELDWEASQDIPMRTPLTKPTLSQYRKDVFERPSLLPEAFFVAVDGERYAGLSSLRPHPAQPEELLTGFTGVARAYRRRGIALALKLRALAYARARDVRTVRTWNAAGNRPMLTINDSLGFVRQPPWITYQQEIGGRK